ncbi:TOMM precursor leader peptide-binding protein [Rugamonas rubra]|uniref:Bacteriocin biosynthesis cyclodehydratase domain-containing protein n=1 Tax=Rugamonas rubra TaxID=758825 RepID=A0A1I4SB34_9BURK|nr:TOMM precursor leader peptide-binding protein [Rugamonas rubra]SFM61541.1 bacteriocin biosynthesis cyclodehydratase domain-containing protein [Rugamonas rubra]
MNDCLYVSPLAEITTIGADKIALSVVGRRFTVEDKVGMLKGILALARDGVSRDALVEHMADSFPAEAVDAALKALLDTKVLVRHNGRASGDATHEHLTHRRELEGLTMPGQGAAYERANWLVALAGEGACADALAASFAELDVAVLRVGADAALPCAAAAGKRALLIVCADHEDYALFRAMNAKAVEAGMPSLYVGIDWSTVQCGPLVMPRATACYECYFHRVRGTRKFVAEFDVRSLPDAIMYHAVPSKLALRFGVAEASRVALQYLSGTLENLQHSVFSEIDSLSGEIHRSRILRLPRCAACGNASSARPVGSVFQQALLRRRA